jgi:hypothetical protein
VPIRLLQHKQQQRKHMQLLTGLQLLQLLQHMLLPIIQLHGVGLQTHLPSCCHCRMQQQTTSSHQPQQQTQQQHGTLATSAGGGHCLVHALCPKEVRAGAVHWLAKEIPTAAVLMLLQQELAASMVVLTAAVLLQQAEAARRGSRAPRLRQQAAQGV